MLNKNFALTISAFSLLLSAPASAFFIDDFVAPQQVNTASNGPTPRPNPTVVTPVDPEIWGTRTVEIQLVRALPSDRREALIQIASPNPVVIFRSDTGVEADYNVSYAGGQLATGIDFTEDYVLDHLSIDVLDVDAANADLATTSLSVRLTDIGGNAFSVTRSPAEVFDAEGGQVFYNLEDYQLAGVDITQVTDVRLRIVSGAPSKDGIIGNFQVVDRIPVPGSLLLLLPALALVKRRKVS